jgi:hypothetical protein
MNRERITQELPPAVATWLADASPDLWDAVTRDVALRLGRALLRLEGWNRPARARFLATCTSPALLAVLPALPVRQWGAYTVARPLCAYFELFGAEDNVRRQLGEFAQKSASHAA